ncbi:MAG: diaminopimelate decarboxylase [Solirubrobacteraceae bacterium]|nr:diaminopimelate decarboxylase [Solirubrobacteraceae bacterium]
MATAQSLSHVFPQASRVNPHGRLEVGGCDAVELAREFGTPAYIVAEDDLRTRARAYLDAFRAAGHHDFQVTYAAKAFPCTAVMALFAEEGLGCDVASAGELHLALRAGFDPGRLVFHGNARSDSELDRAVSAGVGLIVIDNFDDIDRLDRLDRRGARQPVLIRVTPGVAGATHAKISTGQADSKFGLGPADARRAIERLAGSDRLELVGLHMHIGSQLLDLTPYRAAMAVLGDLGRFPVYDLGGGLGAAYAPADRPPPIEDFVAALVAAASALFGPGRRLLVEPGRSLVANAGVTLYTVQTVKRNVSTWVGVDGGMSDNLRPMLYGAHYEAEIVDRLGGDTLCHLTGKHCESGDLIVRDARLDDPRPGDVLVTPATGAYGYAMANNYNGVPRPPVVFCRDGDARLVVRRETLDDLHARDL